MIIIKQKKIHLKTLNDKIFQKIILTLEKPKITANLVIIWIIIHFLDEPNTSDSK